MAAAVLCPCCDEPLGADTVALPCLHFLCARCLADVAADDTGVCTARMDEGLPCNMTYARADAVTCPAVPTAAAGDDAGDPAESDVDDPAPILQLRDTRLPELAKAIQEHDAVLAALAAHAAEVASHVDDPEQRAQVLQSINADIKTVETERDALVLHAGHIKIAIGPVTPATRGSPQRAPRVGALLAAEPKLYPSVYRSADATLGFKRVAKRDFAGMGPPQLILPVGTKGRGSGPGQLQMPWSVAAMPDGSVAVADALNMRVQFFTQTGQLVRTLSTNEQEPYGLALAPSGDLWVTLPYANCLRLYSVATGDVIKEVAVSNACAVAVLPDGSLVASLWTMDKVQLVTPDATEPIKWTSSGNVTDESTSGFRFAWGVTVVRDEVFVCDNGNKRILVLSLATGKYVRMIAQEQVSHPSGICHDPVSGLLLVSERFGVSAWTLDGTKVGYFGGSAASALPGQFNGAHSLSLGRDGTLFVADSYNHRIQLF